MIANARMYSVSSDAAGLWRSLLSGIASASQLPVTLVDHAEPAPISALWARNDMGAVFMCGLPYSRADPRPTLVAAPVPSPAEYAGEAYYWSEMVVRADSRWATLQDTFGGRLALTVPDSQSGYAAVLAHLMTLPGPMPRFAEVIAPTVTPLGALRAVIHGAADVAPIDSYAFALLRKFRPELTAQVRSVARTPRTPIPALVASQPGAEALQSAFLVAHENASMKDLMDALMLNRFVRPEPAGYMALRARHAVAQAYWRAHPLAAVIHPAFVL